MRKPQQRPTQENEQEGYQHDPRVDLPTPPPTTFSTPPEALPTTDTNGDLDMQIPIVTPGEFRGLEPVIPTGGFDQDTTTAVSSAQHLLSAATTVANGQTPSTSLPCSIHLKPLTKLADLQANLLVDIDLVKNCRSAEKCPEMEFSDGPVSDYNFIVGRMFEHAKNLVEIVDCFVPSQSSLAAAANGHASAHDHHPPQIRCDVPTTLVLFSCYICVVRIYRTIISAVHDSFPFMISVRPCPQLFPGINLGGFHLETRVDLQILILVQVSEDLLSKIESRFGLANHSQEPNGIVYQHSGAPAILRMMLDEEASEQPPLHERRGHCDPLTVLLANLKRMAQDGHGRNKG